GGGGGEGGGRGGEELEPEEMVLEFARCMREQGLDVPDPEPGGGMDLNMDGQDQAVVEAAMEACRHLDPALQPDQTLPPERREAVERYAQCMRDEGVEDFPDPLPNGGIAIDDPAIMEDPDYEAAEETCQAEMPGDGEGQLDSRER
ncbi:hypothetical protein RM780_19025, partial [Streptomyces sp. DSM 44917]